MNILKIVNGKIEVRKDNGSLIRTFSVTSGDTAVNADFNGNQSLIAITTAKGKTDVQYPANDAKSPSDAKENGIPARGISAGRSRRTIGWRYGQNRDDL